MPRPEKVEAVAAIKERLEAAQAVFLTEYAGLSVQEQQTLRRGLRGSGAEYKVVKMSLARRAAADLGLELEELLSGPTGLAYADGDPVAAAKVLRDFAGEHEALLIKGALMSGELLTPERVHALADIEPREVLLARLAGGFQAPLSRLAGVMAALLRGSATVFQQLLERKEEAEPAPEPAAEPVAEEPESSAADEAEESEAGAPAAEPEPGAYAAEEHDEDEPEEAASEAASEAPAEEAGVSAEDASATAEEAGVMTNDEAGADAAEEDDDGEDDD